MGGQIWMRNKGSGDDFATPERDVLRALPNMLVDGAAYAACPSSNVNEWLETQMPGGTKAIRDQLLYLLDVLDKSKSASAYRLKPQTCFARLHYS